MIVLNQYGTIASKQRKKCRFSVYIALKTAINGGSITSTLIGLVFCDITAIYKTSKTFRYHFIRKWCSFCFHLRQKRHSVRISYYIHQCFVTDRLVHLVVVACAQIIAAYYPFNPLFKCCNHSHKDKLFVSVFKVFTIIFIKILNNPQCSAICPHLPF